MKLIEVVIRPDGHSIVETKGFVGPACQEVSRFLEQALGQRLAEQCTPDFFQSNRIDERQQERS